MSEQTFIIVGAGQAGGRAAQALRQAGFEDRIILVGEETHAPYERPPLSKDLILTDAGFEKVRLHDEDWYGENNVDFRGGVAATAIDPAAKTVTLSSGETLSYDKLLLTTGARVRRIPIDGADLDGVFYVRTIEDSQNIRARLKDGTKVVVIGGGFIGLETAASASKRGAKVTVLEGADRLMGRSVAPEVGEWFAGMHAKNGVDIRLNVSCTAIEGANGKVTGVKLGDGEVVPADMVVVGIGILPNVEIAEAAGLKIDNGIVVDAHGRTSDPDIYSAGDCANQPNAFTGRRLRLESYQNAQDQGMAVARNMLGGEEKPYEDSLWVWSDQHDVNLQMTGAPERYDELVWRGDVDAGEFMVFYLLDGKIVAVNTINNGREMKAAQRVMASGKSFTAEELADTSVKLLKLAKG
jgi:3-phenylpropionate/trans-cinnamate dioxygenase ferredoxin reductase subunit